MESEFEKALEELGKSLGILVNNCKNFNITPPQGIAANVGDIHTPQKIEEEDVVRDRMVEIEVSWNTYDFLIGRSFRLGQSIDTIVRDACLEYKRRINGGAKDGNNN